MILLTVVSLKHVSEMREFSDSQENQDFKLETPRDSDGVYVSGSSTTDSTSDDAASGVEDARQETSVGVHKDSSSAVAALDSISNCAVSGVSDNLQKLMAMTEVGQKLLAQKDSISSCSNLDSGSSCAVPDETAQIHQLMVMINKSQKLIFQSPHRQCINLQGRNYSSDSCINRPLSDSSQQTLQRAGEFPEI